MKQHITKKQWKEINKEEQKIMLRYLLNANILAYLNVRWGDCYHMNIGQMIEFLGEDWYTAIFFAYPDDGGATVYLKDEEKELCNNLWKEVKYKLKK